ncbi:fasciclin domain-containing protein [Caenimonas terrae]|uniref:Fasciclin domain-containing protein n=1 Tax=Caenimonas terrae TaxID=696074 RepID=A0ABW0NE29_9BURK
MSNRRFLLAASLLALLAGCATPSAPLSVADTLARDPQLSTLNALVQQAGLADMLRGAGPYTVFAPTNEAFAGVPAATMAELKDPARLKAVLSYHVLPARMVPADIKTVNARTANGAEVALARTGDFVTVEDALAQGHEVIASNGVVYAIDRVLMPPRR